MGDATGALTFQMVWQALGPELILIGVGFLILVLDLIFGKQKGSFAPWVSVIGFLAAFALNWHQLGRQSVVLPNAVVFSDDYSNVFGLIFIAGGLLTVLLSVDYLKHTQIARSEYTYLVMFATAGAMMMASSLDLITLFVGLELLSISSYILVAMHRGNAKSAEGGMKYLILGSVATAFLLFGMSYIYGLSGSTNLFDAYQQLQTNFASYKFLILLSLLMVVAGLGIKMSLVPFHMWAPDTYEGAPTPITAFLSVVSKAAGFALLIRIYLFGFLSIDVLKAVSPYLLILAALTMVIGNLAALSQRNVKRILAYSSVAQAGYILIPLCTIGHATNVNNLYQALSETVFYLIVYLVMSYGAFGIFTVVARDAGNENVEAFTGLFARSPGLAVAMTVFLLSMAGMPLTGGFLGKFYIFMGAVGMGYYWAAAVLFAASVISFYYYFGIMKAMFTTHTGHSQLGRVPMHWVVTVVVVLSLIGTVGLGVLPAATLNHIQQLHWFGGA